MCRTGSKRSERFKLSIFAARKEVQRGDGGPLFCWNMDLDSLHEVTRKAAEEKGLFVLDIKSRPGNVFSIFVDGDDFVTLEQLGQLNRAIDSAFDRDQEDYSLEVSSPGALEPLVERRQFPKHVGELMQVELKDGQKLKGSLELVDEGSVELRWKERVPKEIGKGKRTVEIRRTIPFEEIETAKRTVNFKA